MRGGVYQGRVDIVGKSGEDNQLHRLAGVQGLQ
jgi:hypothetical protein